MCLTRRMADLARRVVGVLVTYRTVFTGAFCVIALPSEAESDYTVSRSYAYKVGGVKRQN